MKISVDIAGNSRGILLPFCDILNRIGYAYVNFYDEGEFNKALKEMQGQKIGHRSYFDVSRLIAQKCHHRGSAVKE